MAKQEMDSEEDLKRRTRRRLVGAVALFTALVVIVPMVLDREPKPTGQDIDLSIPDRNKAGEFTSQMVLAESAPVAASQPVAVSAAAATAAPAPAKLPVQQPAAAPAKPAKPAHVPEKAAKPEHAPEKAANPQPKAEKSAKHEHPAKSEHKAASAGPAKSDPAQPGFAVQVGAFANAGSATELRDRLRKQGWHAYTQKASGTVRVRIGPYATREAAEKAQRTLAAQGMQSAVASAP